MEKPVKADASLLQDIARIRTEFDQKLAEARRLQREFTESQARFEKAQKELERMYQSSLLTGGGL